MDDLTFSKIDDKIRFCNSKNKITHTDFFTEPEIIRIQKYLEQQGIHNFFFFGGQPDCDRKMLFFYPDKLNYEMAFKNVNNILKIIRITLPNNLVSTFEHRDYLSAIMKLGIVREKFGDIIVYPKGADIVVQEENSNYFKQNLEPLTRFKKSKIEILDINLIHEITKTQEEIQIIVNSMRIDNFVSEIAHTSRNKVEEILNQERVMINYETITKASKQVNPGDLIIVRGFGKYKVLEISRTTKSGKLVIKLLH